jgi:pimeloyl-ACP methyl ester carboxylesterase
MFLHGGPGAGCQKFFTHFFNPERYRVILFDQRGCGKSTPSASDDDATAALTDNTTAHLIDDVLRLRCELNIHGKITPLAAVGGSTLALAYAIAHPETVQTLIRRGVYPASGCGLFLSGQRCRFRAGSARDTGARHISGFSRSMGAFRHGNPSRRPNCSKFHLQNSIKLLSDGTDVKLESPCHRGSPSP